MFIFLLIYVIGIIATLWIIYYDLNSGTEITLLEFSVIVLTCIFSWITFIAEIMIVHGGKTVFKKK